MLTQKATALLSLQHRFQRDNASVIPPSPVPKLATINVKRLGSCLRDLQPQLVSEDRCRHFLCPPHSDMDKIEVDLLPNVVAHTLLPIFMPIPPGSQFKTFISFAHNILYHLANTSGYRKKLYRSSELSSFRLHFLQRCCTLFSPFDPEWQPWDPYTLHAHPEPGPSQLRLVSEAMAAQTDIDVFLEEYRTKQEDFLKSLWLLVQQPGVVTVPVTVPSSSAYSDNSDDDAHSRDSSSTPDNTVWAVPQSLFQALIAVQDVCDSGSISRMRFVSL